MPLLINKIKLVREDVFELIENRNHIGKFPILVEEFWQTKIEILEWIKTLILNNKESFQINEFVECVEDDEEEFIQQIFNPIIDEIEKIGEMPL